ncbi:hypothetical protein FKM82_019303 [Ascaphus truei]
MKPVTLHHTVNIITSGPAPGGSCQRIFLKIADLVNSRNPSSFYNIRYSSQETQNIHVTSHFFTGRKKVQCFIVSTQTTSHRRADPNDI